MRISAGIRGVGYNVAAMNKSAQVEIYIDRGKEEGKEANLKIYNHLEKHKSSIEKDFGNEMEWERLDGSRACRIKFRSDLGGFQDEETWEDIHNFLVDHLIKLEKAFKGPIKELDRIL